MKPRQQYQLPESKQQQLQRAIKLEWWTIFFLLTITIVMYLTMGSSQAMKTAWIEDMLSLIPPISFLLAMHIRNRAPNDRFPYGYERASTLAFMVASAATLVLGLYLIYDSGHALITMHHPSVGHFALYGLQWEIWSGWVMIGALIYSMIPPVILGRMKMKLAKELHEKTLYADATMNKADWMTAGAAILGILGLGLGFWWADSVAAAIISLDVIKDGFTNVKNSWKILMDSRPTAVEGGEPLDVVDALRSHLLAQPDIADAGVRLREEGQVISGELLVVFTDPVPSAARMKEISDKSAELDWRMYELNVVPVELVDN